VEPGPNGTTIRTALVGQSCAHVGSEKLNGSNDSSSVNQTRFMSARPPYD
jgi:hypothetical protein